MDAVSSKKFGISTVATIAIVAAALVFASWRAEAAVVVTAATGGGAISVDTAATATTPTWTSLGAIVITEGATTDITVEGPVTMIFTAPGSFEFNTGQAADVVATGADITGTGTGVVTFPSATEMTLTYTAGGTATSDVITIGGVTPIQVRPTGGAPGAGGNIMQLGGTPGTQTPIVGVTTDGTNFGTLTTVLGAANKLAITGQPSASTVAGVAIAAQPIVMVLDQHGNTVTGDTSTVVLALTTGTGVLSGTASMAAVAGVANFTGKGLSIDLVGADKVLTATDGGLTLDTTAAFTITHAAASKLILVTPPSASTVAGVAFAQQPIVQVQDAFNNIATSDSATSVTLTLTTGTGALTGTASKTAVSGVADFAGLGLKIDLVGADKVLTANGGGFTAAVSGAFTITVAAPAKLAVTTQPSASTVAGVAFAQQPIVTVQDAFGNTITTDSATSVTLTLTTGTGALTGTVNKTAVSGIADFAGLGLKIDLVGSNKVLTAAGGGYTAATTSAFTITNAAASKLAFTTQPSASTAVDVAFTQQPIVTVQDAFGNTVVGDTSTVTLTLTTGSGTLAGTLTKAAVAGVASFAGQGVAIDLVGADKVLTANGGGYTLATTSAFAVVAAAAAADPAPEEPAPTKTDDGVTVTVENTETTTTSTTVEVELTTTSSSGSEAAITVPAGALPAGTTLEVSAISNLASLETQARPPTSVDVTVAFSIKATANGSAVENGFNEPVALQFTVDASTLPAGATDDQLRLAFWNGLRWVLVDGTVTINADGTATIVGATDHFTLFAVMYNPAGFGTTFEGELPTTGVGFVTFGGTTAQLETALVNQSCISPIFVTSDGEWIGFIPTVQFAAVNAAFNALFADGIPLGTPMVATGCND